MAYGPSDPTKTTLSYGPNITAVYYEALLTEQGAHVYTVKFPIPAGGTVYDVFWTNEVLWSAATSAAMKIGDDVDDDAFTNATTVNLKTLTVDGDEPQGGSSQASLAGKTKRYPNGGNVNIVVTSVGAGTAGRTTVGCWILVPSYTATPVLS